MASSVNFLVHLSPSHGHASNNSHATAKDDQTGEKFSWMWRGTIEDGFWHPMDVQDVQTSCTVWQVRWEMFLSVMCQERMKNMRVHLPYRPFSKLYLDHLSRASGIPGGSKSSQSSDTNFTHVVSACGLTCIFILHENIDATWVIKLSQETMIVSWLSPLKPGYNF